MKASAEMIQKIFGSILQLKMFILSDGVLLRGSHSFHHALSRYIIVDLGGGKEFLQISDRYSSRINIQSGESF